MRKGPRQRGFSFVELLVTIVLLGIFFAALVPVFVLASKQGSIDKARVAALDIAQGKIEGIRNLSYARLYTPGYLESPELGFGTHWPNDDDPQYTIVYTITPVPANPAPGQQQYSIVNVKVGRYDSAHPYVPRPTNPVPVQLRTAVYQQSAGPEITSLDVQPRANGDRWIQPFPGQILTQVNVTARLNTLDSGRTSTVVFAVYANSGGLIASSRDSEGMDDVTRNGDVFTWIWDVTDAPDAWYTFTAVALATLPPDYPGNMWQVQYGLNRQPPPRPTWKSVKSGYRLVELAWNDFDPSVGDLRGFVIERSTNGTEWTRIPLPTAELPSWSRYFIDKDPPLDPATTYQYRLWSVDGPGQLSLEPSLVRAAPSFLGTPPPSPGAPTYVGQPIVEGKSLRLTWNAPVNAASSGVVAYRVYRDDQSLTTPIHVEPAVTGTTYTWNDNLVDWDQSYTYRVTAVTDLLAESLPAMVIVPPITVPLYNLSVQVTTTLPNNLANKTTWRASIVSVATGKAYPSPSGMTTDQKLGRTYVQSGLPYSRYSVTVYFYNQNGYNSATKTQDVDLTGSRSPVTFSYP